VAGLVAYALFSGFSALSPTRLYWVMDNMDLPTHYLGWQFFREVPWMQWPIGSIPLYGYDSPGSIVLTDSIPLLALLFKLFSAWLPADFQYFGIWSLACFLLQSWFACKLLQRFSGSAVFCLAGVFFFATASTYVSRLYFHPALAGQWLLLAAMCLHFSPTFRKGRWIALLLVAVLVHAYLFLMVGAIWAADMAQRMYRREVRWQALALHAALSVVCVVVVMWAVGYFVPAAVEGVQARTRANLLFPFWTGQSIYNTSWSAILPGFPMDPAASDGFGYFGLGFLVLVGCALLLMLRTPHSSPPVILRSSWITLASICLFAAVYAFSNDIYAGDKLVFSYAVPHWLDRVYGVFRGAGRLIWPLWYLILFASLYQVATRLPARGAGWLLAALLILQCIDIAKPVADYRKSFQVRKQEWSPQLASPLWPVLGENYEKIAFLVGGERAPSYAASPFLLSMNPQYQQVADFAAKHGLGINVANSARVDEAKAAAARERRVRGLLSGEFEPGTLYVVNDKTLQQRAGCVAPEHAWIGRIDGIDLIVPGGQSLPELAKLAEAPCPPR
jgi:hypothetical protein